MRCASAGDGFRGVAATIPGAAALDRAEFEDRVTGIYEHLLGGLRRDGYHPLRFWNFVPRINEEVEPGLSHYMAFNVARWAGYRAVHAPAGDLTRSIATASCVGAPGGSLHVFCVATREQGLPVENPRQVPAYGYSQKYGPQPPCFSRAMLVRSRRPLLIVGGTASVRGEDTVHARNLAGQTGGDACEPAHAPHSGVWRGEAHTARRAARRVLSLRAYVGSRGERRAGPRSAR